MSLSCQIWYSCVLCKCLYLYNMFNLSRIFKRANDYRIIWIYGFVFLVIFHNPAMFGCHWSTASGDKAFLICHVTSQDHAIERSCGLMGGSSSLYVASLSSLIAIGIMLMESVSTLPRFYFTICLVGPCNKSYITLWMRVLHEQTNKSKMISIRL